MGHNINNAKQTKNKAAMTIKQTGKQIKESVTDWYYD